MNVLFALLVFALSLATDVLANECVVETGTPTFSNGKRINLQCDANGKLKSIASGGGGAGDASNAEQLVQSGLLTDIETAVDGLETAVASTNTKLDTIDGHVGGQVNAGVGFAVVRHTERQHEQMIPLEGVHVEPVARVPDTLEEVRAMAGGHQHKVNRRGAGVGPEPHPPVRKRTGCTDGVRHGRAVPVAVDGGGSGGISRQHEQFRTVIVDADLSL